MGLAWLYRRLTARLRALPDFLIIGAARSGTTSTYHYLTRHPHVERAWLKEVHFFDAPAPIYDSLGEIWYRAHFPFRRPGLMTGEATPRYMFHAEASERIARHLPQARLVALLRNPVDRTVSHYYFAVRRRREARPFEAVLNAQHVEVSAQVLCAPPSVVCGDEVSRRARPVWDDGAEYLARGLYAEQLENVLRVFPRDQLLVVASEELFARPAETVGGIFEFLGLPAHEVRVSDRLNAVDYAPLTPAVRARLVEFFRPHNQRLYELLGRDFGWDR